MLRSETSEKLSQERDDVSVAPKAETRAIGKQWGKPVGVLSQWAEKAAWGMVQTRSREVFQQDAMEMQGSTVSTELALMIARVPSNSERLNDWNWVKFSKY